MVDATSSGRGQLAGEQAGGLALSGIRLLTCDWAKNLNREQDTQHKD